jgi:hypothetical protein
MNCFEEKNSSRDEQIPEQIVIDLKCFAKKSNIIFGFGHFSKVDVNCIL